MKYQKKPIVIEAFQMTFERRADNSEWPQWMHEAWNKVGANSITPTDFPVSDGKDRLKIVTLEGEMTVEWGDWIIRGVKGELYPCKPDIFEATYDAVADTVPPETLEDIAFLTHESKGFREDLDAVLQRMKIHRTAMSMAGITTECKEPSEVPANHILSLRAVEDAIMRQGMVLKSIGANTNPYPKSYDRTSSDIEPTAGGLKL